MSKILKLRRIADLDLATAQATDQLLAQRNGESLRLLASDFATSAQGGAADTAIQPEDIDTLAGLNGILTDATLIDTNDSRLSDARAPTAHKSTHSTGGSDALSPADIGAATSAQGTLADSAVQPGDLAAVAISGDYGDLINLPTLGTAAAQDITAFATSAQGMLADSAVQPGDLATVATTGDYDDLTNKPTLGTAAATDSTAYATSAQGSLADSAVQPARKVDSGTGLAGGGDLSADRTLSLSSASQASLVLADSAVQPAQLAAVTVKVGVKPNEIPANAYLGAMAYQDSIYLPFDRRPIVPLTSPTVQDLINAFVTLGVLRQED